MRYGVFSDVHSNLEALKSVLKAIEKDKVDKILCLGDIVGYGPNPNECVERIRKLNVESIVGNHDYVMVNDSLLDKFNPLAQEVTLWTRKVLKQENLQYLVCLPFAVKLPDILLVHSTPFSPRSFDYIFNVIDALPQFRGFQERICFVGHSHVPGIFSSDGDVFSESVQLQDGLRYIINVGSVGQPRDDDPRACYGVLDTDCLTFSLKRVDYYIKKTAKKIVKSGLPKYLAERLFTGR